MPNDRNRLAIEGESGMKAIITDLDRTLLRTDKSLSEYTCATLKKCHDRGMLLMEWQKH